VSYPLAVAEQVALGKLLKEQNEGLAKVTQYAYQKYTEEEPIESREW
jgi:hypothetical protein